MTLLRERQIRDITELQRPKAQAKKLRELGFVVLGFSARGRVRALAEHPAMVDRPVRREVILDDYP